MNPMMTPRYDAAYLAWNTVATYETREDAQAAVDRLANREFPIEQLDIVGSDIKLVERVTGRLTRGRLARAGAASGVWTGLLAGLLFSLFAPGGAALAIIVSAAAIGAAGGAGLALLARSTASSAGGAGRGAATPLGQFATMRMFVAGRYDLVARNGLAEQARAKLQEEQPLVTA
jgi:hypothetical protein